MKTIFQVTIGILLAGAIAFAVRLVFLAFFVSTTVDVMNEQTAKLQAQSQARVAALQAEQRRKASAREEVKRREAAAEKQRQLVAAERAALESAKRQAFEEAYLPPDGCEWPQSEKALIACTNHKMAAKRAFYERYQPAPLVAIPNTADAIQFARDQRTP